MTLLKINTNDSNFSRTVIVEGSNNIKRQKEWRHIASGRISRINAGTFHKEEITINFNAPVRFSYYRIKVNNFDSPALNISGVEVQGQVYEILFFNKESKEYSLFYGGQDIDSPQYDINDVIRNMSTVTTAAFTLGQEKQNQDFNKSGKKPFFNGRQLFIIAVILMVAMLAWMIATVSKKVEESSKEV